MSPALCPQCYKCNTRSKSIFCELSNSDLAILNSFKHYANYKKGQLVFQEGSYPRGLYCVFSGKLKITQTGVDGKEQIIHLAKQGDTLGYRAILSGDKYSCSALALENASLCFIAKDVFYSLVEKNAGVALQIINLFSKELKDAERKITSFAQNSIKERLAQSLLLLKENYGLENDGYTINASVTREEIANITGTTRETAIRNLFELNDDGIIELKGKKIKIISLQELIKTANVFD